MKEKLISLLSDIRPEIDFEEETVSQPVKTEKKVNKKPSRREMLKMLQD